MKMIRHGSRGLGIPEIAVALLIVGLAMVPIYSMISHGSSGTIQTSQEMQAFVYANNLLEAAKAATDFDGDPLLQPCQSREIPEILGTHSRRLEPTPMNRRFQRFLTIAEEQAAGFPYRYKTLMVEVRWDGPGGGKNLKLSGLVFTGGKQ